MDEASPGTSSSGEVVTGAAEYVHRCVDLIREARLDLCIFSHHLERRVYASEDFVAAVRAFALQHRRSRVRVLVHSPTMRGGNRLVELGRVLSSRIQFRQLLEDRKNLGEEYLVTDERGVLYKDSYDALEARCYADAPIEARLRLRRFNPLWEESVPAQEYRVLGI